MRKLLLASAAVCFGLGTTGAIADVGVTATITVDKDIFITETIVVTKDVFLEGIVFTAALKAAEAMALVNQANHDNYACSNCAEKQDIMRNSANSNAGLLNSNQASGNMNNQANTVALAVDARVGGPPNDGGPPPVEGGFAESQAHAEQRNGGTAIPDQTPVPGEESPNEVDSINLAFRDAIIATSINGNQGILNVNQAVGNMNNQANTLAIAVSFATDGVALSEADLGQSNLNNLVQESDQFSTGVEGPPAGVGINKSASLTGSITGNTGIVGVNQAAGNMANQANLVSLAALTGNGVTPP